MAIAVETPPDSEAYIGLDETMYLAANQPTIELLWRAADHAIQLADQPASAEGVLGVIHRRLAGQVSRPSTLTRLKINNGESGKPVILDALAAYAAAQLITVEACVESEDSAAARNVLAAQQLAIIINTAGYREPSWEDRSGYKPVAAAGIKMVEDHLAQAAKARQQSTVASGKFAEDLASFPIAPWLRPRILSRLVVGDTPTDV